MQCVLNSVRPIVKSKIHVVVLPCFRLNVWLNHKSKMRNVVHACFSNVKPNLKSTCVLDLSSRTVANNVVHACFSIVKP